MQLYRTNPLTSMDQFRRLLAFGLPYPGRLLLALAASVQDQLAGARTIVKRPCSLGTQPSTLNRFYCFGCAKKNSSTIWFAEISCVG